MCSSDLLGLTRFAQSLRPEPRPQCGPDFPGPVSYTHLDVYKRQAVHDTALKTRILNGLNGLGKALTLQLVVPARRFIGRGEVDVYKRQA